MQTHAQIEHAQIEQVKTAVRDALQAGKNRDEIANAVLASFGHMMTTWPGGYSEPMALLIGYADIIELFGATDHPEPFEIAARRQAHLLEYWLRFAVPRLCATYPIGTHWDPVAVDVTIAGILGQLCDAIEAGIKTSEHSAKRIETILSWPAGELNRVLSLLRAGAPGTELWQLFAVCQLLDISVTSRIISWTVERTRTIH